MSMIPILSYPDFDGNRYSRTSVDLVVDNIQRVVGWTKLEYHRKLTPGKAWGGRAKPQVRTRGKFEPSLTLGVYQEDANLLINYLTAKGIPFGKGWMETSFLLTCTMFEITLGTTRWDGIGCRVAEETASPGGGNDDPIEVTLTLDVMDLLKDGVSAVFENSPFGQVGVAV